MATRFNSWDSYFWEPGGPVLRNLYGLRDGADLSRREYAETNAQQFDIERGAISIPRTYDAEHLRTIHRELFKNVYEWAGEYRSVGMFKPPLEFARPEDIGRYLADASRLVRGAEWAGMDRQQFAAVAADVFAHVNQAHPFREGNGRSGKLFMQHVSELSGFKLDYSPERTGITAEVWNYASAMSRPDLGSCRPVPDSLVPVFERLAVARVWERSHEAGRGSSTPDEKESPSLERRIADKLSELRALSDASYPRPAADVTRTAPQWGGAAQPYRPRGDRGKGIGGR